MTPDLAHRIRYQRIDGQAYPCVVTAAEPLVPDSAEDLT